MTSQKLKFFKFIIIIFFLELGFEPRVSCKYSVTELYPQLWLYHL
jgi:hypothetical protein